MELAAWLQVSFGLVQVLLTLKQIKSVKEQSASQLVHPIRGTQLGWFARVFPFFNVAIIILTIGNLSKLFMSKSALSKSDYFAIAMGFSLLVFVALARYIERVLDAIISIQNKYSSEIRRLQDLIEADQEPRIHRPKQSRKRQ